MKKLPLILAAVIFTLGSSAQKNSPGKIKFHSTEHFGLLNGANAVSASLISVNGLSYKTFFAGAGVGIDFYRYRTIPVFFSLQKEIGQKKRHPFAYGNIGYNVPWIKNADANTEVWWGTWHSNFSGGLYTDVGAGYILTQKNKDALVLSVGYSYKYLEEKRTFTSTGNPPAGEVDPEFYENRFNRIVLSVGWKF